MKNIVIILLIAVALLTGCTTSKRCLAKFPPTTTIRIETDTVTEYKDTIVERFIPGDSIFVFDTTFLFPATVKIEPLTVSLPLAHSTAWINEGRLNLGLWIDSTTLQWKIDSAMATVTVTDSIFITKEIPPPKQSKIAKRLNWILTGALVGILGFLFLFRRVK